MSPYTPMKIALNWPVNKELKEYVDSFVKNMTDKLQIKKYL
jgi:hypothetical protein